MNIPVAHIQGGEVSGTIDESYKTRHDKIFPCTILLLIKIQKID